MPGDCLPWVVVSGGGAVVRVAVLPPGAFGGVVVVLAVALVGAAVFFVSGWEGERKTLAEAQRRRGKRREWEWTVNR